jgi:hypothetical protein
MYPRLVCFILFNKFGDFYFLYVISSPLGSVTLNYDIDPVGNSDSYCDISLYEHSPGM